MRKTRTFVISCKTLNGLWLQLPSVIQCRGFTKSNLNLVAFVDFCPIKTSCIGEFGLFNFRNPPFVAITDIVKLQIQ